MSAIVSTTSKLLIRHATRIGRAFPGELIDQSHQAELATVMGLRLDKIVAPDMIECCGVNRMQGLSFR